MSIHRCPTPAWPWLRRLASLGLGLGLSLAIQGGELPAAAVAQDSTRVDRSAVAQLRLDPHSLSHCPQTLHSRIQQIIDQPTFETAQWGIAVEALSGEVLFYRNRDRFMIPASNVKLLTTAAALQFWGNRDARLETWVGIVNRESDNRSADALLARLGGPGQVKAALTGLGIDPDSYRQVDGSGLSRSNIAQPGTFVKILKTMWTQPGGEIFYRSLPVAGQSGTLRYRFQGTALQGRLRAKTGTLRGVRALSGYLNPPDYEPLVFSIIVNQPGQSGAQMLQAIDAVVQQLDSLTSCPS